MSNHKQPLVRKQDKGTKFDQKKISLFLLPTEALKEVGKALDFGAKKYGSWNWKKGMDWDRLYSATLRHLFAWNEGENLDPESNLNHIAHASCNLLFLMTYIILDIGKDTRFKQNSQIDNEVCE